MLVRFRCIYRSKTVSSTEFNLQLYSRMENDFVISNKIIIKSSEGNTLKGDFQIEYINTNKRTFSFN